jgi:hypothetical protein
LIDLRSPATGRCVLFDQGPADARSNRTSHGGLAVDNERLASAVGDLRFEPLPLLLAGRVVGADVLEPSAYVDSSAVGRLPSRRDDPPLVEQRFEMRGHRCDAEGRFEIRGFPGKLTRDRRSQVATALGAPGSHAIPIGARDVELRQVAEDSKSTRSRGAIAESPVDLSARNDVMKSGSSRPAGTDVNRPLIRPCREEA